MDDEYIELGALVVESNNSDEKALLDDRYIEF